jgi:hypothetical protein
MFAPGFVAPLPEAKGEEMQRMFVGHAHGAEDLVGDGGAGRGCLADPDLGRGGAELGFVAVEAVAAEAGCRLVSGARAMGASPARCSRAQGTRLMLACQVAVASARRIRQTWVCPSRSAAATT